MTTSNDIKITHEIAQIILDSSPVMAKSTIMMAELSSEGDTCRFEFDYVDMDGIRHWMTGLSSSTTGSITRLLVKHREFWLSQGHKSWKKFILTVFRESGKITVNLSMIKDANIPVTMHSRILSETLSSWS